MIAKGVSFGPYEILGRIGAGGMGEVWRARDKRIGREVAVKVLPEEFNDEALKRFEQEARAAGGLNHPGLVTIFDVGTTDHSPYIVMELLEGETLRDALGDGEVGTPLPPRKAIDYAAQVATALAVAHERGIIHRDLKPENLFITSDRRVKILDFGLAKLAANAKDIDGNRRTSQHLTGAGFTIGTPAYMSPEQVRATPVDHRTDIFSFGAVLYEMLTGKLAFERDTVVETMNAILSVEPEPLETAGRGISPELDAIVRHCLEKDPRERFQSARDLAFQLRMVPELQKSRTGHTPVVPPRRRYLAAAIALSVALACVAGGFLLRGLRGTAPATVRQPFQQLTLTDGAELFPTLSADGKSIAYVSSQTGNRDIYVQRVDGRGAFNITSESPADESEPVFSPDGSRIAFRSERDGGGIFVMGVTGDSPVRLTDFGHNPTWSPDGKRIAFSSADPALIPQAHLRDGDLWIVDVATTSKRMLVNGSGDSGSDAMQPSWSPHGNRIAYWSVIKKSGRRVVRTIEPDAPEPARTIVDAVADGSLVWNPAWSPAGRYLYYGGNRLGTFNLWRVRIDEQTGVASGEPETMSLPASLSCHYTFSQQGDLAFTAITRTHRLLAMTLDPVTAQTGPPQALFGTSLDMGSYEASPDRRMIAFTSGGQIENVFVANADGTRLRQLTSGDVKDRRVTWSADGKKLYFYSNRESGEYRIWSVNADGSDLKRLTTQGTFYHPKPSPDGRTIAVQPPALIHLDRPPGQQVEMLQQIIHTPTFSPDGTRLIGGSYTDAGPRSGLALYTIATKRLEKVLDRGFQPQWFPDGRRVVFFERDSVGILDLDTRRAVSSPFSMPGVQLSDPGFPRMSRDGSTIYVKQKFEEADIWLVHLNDA